MWTLSSGSMATRGLRQPVLVKTESSHLVVQDLSGNEKDEHLSKAVEVRLTGGAEELQKGFGDILPLEEIGEKIPGLGPIEAAGIDVKEGLVRAALPEIARRLPCRRHEYG